jgi:HD-GYP domain-containing protein (c-di-GMP phosphodiesterase class II)
MTDVPDSPAQRIADLERLLTMMSLLPAVMRAAPAHNTIGVALASERNSDRLLEQILLEAKALCDADGGTLYLVDDDDAHLVFTIVRNDSLGIARGGTTGEKPTMQPVPLRLASGDPNGANVASCAAVTGASINIADAYDAEGFDFSGTKRFDERNNYRSRSFLTIPMTNSEGRVIGVLQLINARTDGEVVSFSAAEQKIVEALAAQAAVSLDNQRLLLAQRQLLESFIKLIANAIDSKSPYTGGHCARVPVLTQMLAAAAVADDAPPFAGFHLNEDEWYELRIAAWLHDCGKIVTPTHVMDKATKLEKIADRIAEVELRFAVIEGARELQLHRDITREPAQATSLQATFDDDMAKLRDDLVFLRVQNIGAEFTSPEAVARIRRIAERTVVVGGVARPLLSDEEIDNLSISRGTLTHHERLIINGHMVHTVRMLEALPFPRGLRRVPEYATGHHEKMDGTGYPRGLYGSEMSLPARMMAVADVFEALTAQDRPYKKAKTLSETMAIMGAMKRDNHLDPDVFNLFVRSGVYRRYAERFLPSELIDAVDEAALLAVMPKPFAPAPQRPPVRSFLAAYEAAIPARPLPDW